MNWRPGIALEKTTKVGMLVTARSKGVLMQIAFWKQLLTRLAVALALVLTTFAPLPARASTPDLVTWNALAPTQASEVQAESDDWQRQVNDVTPSLLGNEITIDGYVLPLVWKGRRVVEFLLVPWVGACIHTPAPPPNQMVHVNYPNGLRLSEQYEAVRLSGTLQHQPDAHLLFLVDGSRPVFAAYALQDAAVTGQPGDVIAASADNVPSLARLQLWANSLFTDSMSALGNGAPSKALFLALLLSFGYGALHTLGPGHGKTVVISYFVGTGGSLRRGVTMGTRIAVFHVLSAVLIVFVLDFAVRQATGSAPSDYRAIRLGSYALIIAIGAVMLWQAISAILKRRSEIEVVSSHVHDHVHHDHQHDHAGCAACASAASPKGSGWVAASIGIVPCTGALIVMLFGLANDLILPAVLMVVAISAGMALAMSAIGIAALWGRNWVELRFATGSNSAAQFELGARLTGALCVFGIGVVLFWVTWTFHPMLALPPDGVAMGFENRMERIN